MDTKRPSPQEEQHPENTEEREVFDVMRNENADMISDIFTFRNVLLAALVMGAAILISYMLGAL